MAAKSEDSDLTELLQTRLPKHVKKLVEEQAAETLSTEAAWLRRLVFQHFKLMPKTKKKAG